MGTPVHAPDAVDFRTPVDREHARRIGRAWVELRRGAWTAALRDHLYGDDHPLEQGSELGPLGAGEHAEDAGHRGGAAAVDLGVAGPAERGDAHHDDPPVVGGGNTFGQPVGDESLDGPGGRRRFDAQPLGEPLHRPVAADEEVEGVHLALLERMVESLDHVGTELGGRADG